MKTNCGTPNSRSDHKFWTKKKCETTTATTATATSITQTTTTTLPANEYPLGAVAVNPACPRGSCGGKACAGELEFAYLTAPDGKLVKTTTRNAYGTTVYHTHPESAREHCWGGTGFVPAHRLTDSLGDVAPHQCPLSRSRVGSQPRAPSVYADVLAHAMLMTSSFSEIKGTKYQEAGAAFDDKFWVFKKDWERLGCKCP